MNIVLYLDALFFKILIIHVEHSFVIFFFLIMIIHTDARPVDLKDSSLYLFPKFIKYKYGVLFKNEL